MSSKELQDHAAAMLKQEDDAKVSDPNKRRERWTDDEKALLIEAFKRDPRADAMAAAVPGEVAGDRLATKANESR